MFKGIFFRIFPYGSINAEIPVLADLKTGSPCSIALALIWTMCCCGPLYDPNQASFVKWTIKSEFKVFASISFEKIDS